MAQIKKKNNTLIPNGIIYDLKTKLDHIHALMLEKSHTISPQSVTQLVINCLKLIHFIDT